MAASTMVGSAKTIMHFGIFVFVEAQEINLRGNLQDSKSDDIVFLMRTFSFCKEDPCPFGTVFFS